MLALLALAAAVSAQEVNLMREKQIALGEHLAREFRKRTIPFPAVEEYVRRLGKRLTPPDAHWQFEVIKDDVGGSTREPVTFPGYIFVPARLLLMTGSEAELAGMLAHAVAHLMEPPTKLSIYNTAGDSVPRGLVDTERARELAADRSAAEIMAGAGYSPRALIDYLRRVQWAGPAKNSRLPPLADRVAAIDEVASAAPPRSEWKESTAAFTDAQETARELAPIGPQRRPTLFGRD